MKGMTQAGLQVQMSPGGLNVQVRQKGGLRGP